MDQPKSSVEEIRARFDSDVERFSKLEEGQRATMDAAYVLDLIAEGASATNPTASDILDIGCGAGNFTLKVVQRVPVLRSTLLDISRPMLDRAVERVAAAGVASITPLQEDVRNIRFGDNSFDIIVASAVLHHLRTDAEWHDVFGRIHGWLKPGGTFWVWDLIAHNDPRLHSIMYNRYGQYLSGIQDDQYRDHVFAYIEKEDTPRSLPFQLELARKSGFSSVDVLHCNAAFAAYCAVK